MWQFVLSTWRAGIRSRSIRAVLVVGLLLVGVAYLSASFSPRQPKTVALDVGLSGIRLSLVLFSLFWVLEMLGMEIQRRTVLFSLSYPTARGKYLLGRFLGISSLLGVAALLLGGLLWVVVLNSGGNYTQGFSIAAGSAYWATIFGLWLDVVVVTAFTVWVASISTVTMLPLALGLAFAMAGKSLGAVVDYLAQGAEGDPSIQRLAPLIDAIQWVLPDLSRLDWRFWPMYGLMPDQTAVTGSLVLAASYISALLALAVMMFRRREFN
jgi:ABC-type transport system involved in multi-copper enzyme maturation permease subunit